MNGCEIWSKGDDIGRLSGHRKAIASGGAAGLQTRLGTSAVPGMVRLHLLSASFFGRVRIALLLNRAAIFFFHITWYEYARRAAERDPSLQFTDGVPLCLFLHGRGHARRQSRPS